MMHGSHTTSLSTYLTERKKSLGTNTHNVKHHQCHAQKNSWKSLLVKVVSLDTELCMRKHQLRAKSDFPAQMHARHRNAPISQPLSISELNLQHCKYLLTHVLRVVESTMNFLHINKSQLATMNVGKPYFNLIIKLPRNA